MKKNISVNIFGTIYHIDEDAYELLQKYNENMKRYYSRRPGGEEIADDVEHRVAELLSEITSQGVMAVTIDDVKRIIERIGDPQEMDDNATADNIDDDLSTESTGTRQESGNRSDGFSTSSNAYSEQDSGRVDRKLFRDPEDKFLGGVLSGLSHYFGLKEPIVLRLLALLLVFCSVSFIIPVYIIAWILIPEAVTPEDRLRMYGKPINAKAINEELMRGVNKTNEFVSNPQHRETARGFLSAAMRLMVFLVGLFFVFILGMMLLGLVAAVIGLIVAFLFGIPNPVVDNEVITLLSTLSKPMVAIMLISAFLTIGLPLYGIIRVMTTGKNEKGMSAAAKIIVIVLWIFSLFALIGSIVAIGKKTHFELERLYRTEHTHNGVYLRGNGWKTITNQGWNVEKLTGVNEWVTDWGEMPNGDNEEYLSLSVANNPKKMLYNLSQESNLRPGTYRIDGYVRADGEGNALYVVNNSDTLRIDIPRYQEPENEISDEEVVIDSRGDRKWTHVEGTFEVRNEGNVKYGISNESRFSNNPWNSRKIAIADVRIGKI